MRKEFISPKEIHDPGSYSHAVKVGNTIYVAGQVGMDKDGKVLDGFEAQALKAFENMKVVLETAGASFKNVVKLNGYFKTYLKDRPKYHEIRSRFFSPPLPIATNVQVDSLALPELLLEVEAVAVIDSGD
jgi:enamine deaminase RidA (YjgF/YER057c/UK114 family)